MIPLLLSIPLIAAAPVPKDFKKETPVLDGAWQMTGMEFNGRRLGGNQNSVWRFEGETLTIQNPGGGQPRPIPVKLDLKATPMEFQFANGGSQLGVLEIKDDQLVICLSQRQGVRPADAAGGPNAIRYLFTRAKDK